MPATLPFSLTGKTIVITGASSGIGRQCAITCSMMGASTILFGRDQDRLDETMALLTDRERHISYSVDFSERNDLDAVIKDAVGRSGKLSGLINCAGVSTTLPLRMLTAEKMELFLNINVVAPLELTKIVVKPTHISPDGASVIFMTSVMATVGELGKTLYSMTKGALLSASRSLALELAAKKIRVNCISPGVVETPMSKSAVYSQNEESLAKIRNLHPLGLGNVDDVANASLFLLSDEARWITGTNLMVDGGYTAR